jgi:hypothetical protein
MPGLHTRLQNEQYGYGIRQVPVTSVICQIDLQVFAGFLGFPGFRKPGNLETWKLKLTNYTVQHLVINRLLMKENP